MRQFSNYMWRVFVNKDKTVSLVISINYSVSN